MERELEERVLSYMREKHMIEEKQAILAGVSGGADSVCLLLLLCSLKSRLDLRLFVVHVEHGIRGEESLADARFVRDLCKRLSVPCQVCPVDVPGRAKRLGQSLEEAGRTARYEIFEREARALEERHGRKCRIAVAHNANDNAETMLYHLARGTGIRGLAGIPPERGRIIRPLLALKREEIEAYLEEKGQKFCRDATNETDLYRRNRIRHRILPVMEELNPEAVRHMGRTGEMLGELDAWLQEVADRVLGEAVEPDGLRKEPLRKLPEPLRREVLHRWIARIWGENRDISCRHVEALAELLEAPAGKEIWLPGGRRVISTYRHLTTAEEDGREPVVGAVMLSGRQLTEQGTMEMAAGGYRFSFALRRREKNAEIPRKSYTKWFDYDKIKDDFEIRNRQPEDYLVIDDQGRRKPLNRYFIDEKVPRDRRDALPLLACGHHVIWVPGYRISAYYKVDETTENILEVQVREEEKDE